MLNYRADDRNHQTALRLMVAANHRPRQMPRVVAYVTVTPSGRYRGCASVNGALFHRGEIVTERKWALAAARAYAEEARILLRVSGWKI